MYILLVPSFQDAKKGVLFIDFPPVLQLQLKRFEYDFMRDTMVKVGSTINILFCTLSWYLFQYAMKLVVYFYLEISH